MSFRRSIIVSADEKSLHSFVKELFTYHLRETKEPRNNEISRRPRRFNAGLCRDDTLGEGVTILLVLLPRVISTEHYRKCGREISSFIPAKQKNRETMRSLVVLDDLM